MRAQRVFLYVLAGAVLGCLAGLSAAAALGQVEGDSSRGLLLACLSGLLLSAAGGAAMRSHRAFGLEVPLGAALGAAFFAAGRAMAGAEALSGDLGALAAVSAVLVFSAAVAAVHVWRAGGGRISFSAAVFAAVAGLAALAAAAKLVSPARLYTSLAAAGALYGAAIWGAVGFSRRLFEVDVAEFRV